MADPVKHDHADDDRGGGTIRPGVLYLPAYDDVSNATGAEAGDVVYATGNGTSAEGVYRYDGSSYTILGTSILSDSGTDTDSGDDYQMPAAADNIDLQNDGAIQNAESIQTDDLNIGGSDLIQSGEFALIGPSFSAMIKEFSTTSTSYVSDPNQFLAEVNWGAWAPNGATTMIHSRLFVGSSAADIRLRNPVDGENVFEQLDVAGNTQVVRSDNYTPTTTNGRITFEMGIKTNDGGTNSRIDSPAIDCGVQL